MQTSLLQQAEETLRSRPRGELESLTLAYVRSHSLACELLGQEKPDHVTAQEIEGRIKRLNDTVLIDMLLPLAAVAAGIERQKSQ
jgi:hypothetical protein